MSLKVLAYSLSALSTVSVTPLVFSKPEDADLSEKTFELKKCVLNTWGSSNAHLFKCQIGGKVWAFYLSSAWNNWFYGSNNSRGGGGRSPRSTGGNQNDLSDIFLTLETGHKKIVVNGKNINKDLSVVWLESSKKDRRVFGYAPDSINKPVSGQANQGKSIKEQMLSSLENLHPEYTPVK